MFVRIRPLAAAALGLSLLSGMAARADSIAQAHQQIQGLYRRMDTALGKADAAGVLSITTPDFVTITEQGQKVSRSGTRALLIEMFNTMSALKCATQVQKLTLSGNTASVQVIARFSYQAFDAEKQKFVPQTLLCNYADTWVKRAGGWRQSRSRFVSSRRA